MPEDLSINAIMGGVFFILGIFIYEYVKEKARQIARNKRKRTLEESNEHDVFVDQVLYNLLNEMGADRATFSRFHNGQFFEDGESFKKYTKTNIAVREGIASLFAYPLKYREVSLSLDAVFFKRLFREKLTKTTISDMEVKSYLKSLMTLNDTSVLFSSVVYVQGSLYGFISIHYTKYNEPDSDIDIKPLIDAASKLGALQ